MIRKFFRTQLVIRAAVLVPLALALPGCGGLESSISGHVTLDGQPLTSGTVTFHPQSGGAVAYGTIDERGVYEIKTGSSSGLTAGEYVVTVMANEPVPEATRPLRGQMMEPTGKLLVPVQYIAKQTSDLRATVQPGRNTVDLALQSQP